MKILLIEDEKITRITLSETLSKNGYHITACATGSEGLTRFQENKFNLVLTDLRLPKMNGLDILKKIKAQKPDCPVILMTAYASVESAVQALKLGAYDYLTKPFSPDELLTMLQRIEQFNQVMEENIRLKQRIHSFENRTLIGQTEVMRLLIHKLNLVAQNDYTVLIQGESGTGKEVAARYLHFHSYRHDAPFVAINCAAIPETLLESELFGYEKGAFTGANRRHRGYIERADKGTLFIDDIDDLPYSLQVKLLRFLQEKEIQRIGSSDAIPIDVRIITATKVDLRSLIEEKKFREDLYYRLNIIPINLPPLRERTEDIPMLIEHFFQKHSRGENKPKLTENQLEQLMHYAWPGNVRELENVVERMIAIPGNDYFLEQLRTEPLNHKFKDTVQFDTKTFEQYNGLQAFLNSKEKEMIDWALKKVGQNISQAARLLNIPRSTLQSKLEKLRYNGESSSNKKNDSVLGEQDGAG